LGFEAGPQTGKKLAETGRTNIEVLPPSNKEKWGEKGGEGIEGGNSHPRSPPPIGRQQGIEKEKTKQKGKERKIR